MTINELQFTKFAAVYRKCLGSAIAAKPNDYPWAMWPEDVDRVAAKMMQAIVDGSYNKDGDGFKRTCKALGIKCTYKAINEYLTETIS